ncbi:hypothetical protein AYJ56_04095 [Brucella anthropi]|nr:hypothetical protein AYJ56_04095 [Brucella anthropi]
MPKQRRRFRQHPLQSNTNMQNREFYRSEKRKCPAEAAGHDHIKFTTMGMHAIWLAIPMDNRWLN